MSKRKMPRRELPWIGGLLETLSFSRLPTNHVVLQRIFFELESNQGNSSLDIAAVLVKNELIELWSYAGYGDILHFPTQIVKMIKALTSPYKYLLKIPQSRRSSPSYLQKEADFLNSLPKLFNITVSDLVYSQKITAEDREFLLKHWNKKISSTPDLGLRKAVHNKLERSEKRQAYYHKQTAGPSTAASPPVASSDPTPASSDPSPSSTPASSRTPASSPDPEFRPKKSFTTPTSSGSRLLLPKNILQKVGPTADRLGLSNNQLTAITAVITNHGGGDLDDVSLSKSTARRSRASARTEAAQQIRDNFSLNFGQINFDGKLLDDLYGSQKVNRLAVVVVKELENQILGIIKTVNAKGKVEAEAVKRTLDTWKLTEKIIACGFDTTTSNTGVHKGCCTVLQELLGRQILWMACRHHILELVLKAAFMELFGDTTGPEETFFKFMKPIWSTLDLSDTQLPAIPSTFLAEKASVLSFIQQRLKPEQAHLLPRDDYREFLELALLILGGTPERKKGWSYTIQRPGADSHARWMSKAIYTMKLTLLMHQFPDIPWHKKKKLEKMTFFIIFVYLECWFRSPSLFSAASNDLLLHQRLTKFSKYHKKLSQVGLTVLLRHTWYLTEELVPLSLFNDKLPEPVLNTLAENIFLHQISPYSEACPPFHYCKVHSS